jgi:hypothetical protein
VDVNQFQGPEVVSEAKYLLHQMLSGGLSIQEPQDQRYDPANDEAGHDREIETEILPFDHDVAR